MPIMKRSDYFKFRLEQILDGVQQHDVVVCEYDACAFHIPSITAGQSELVDRPGKPVSLLPGLFPLMVFRYLRVLV